MDQAWALEQQFWDAAISGDVPAFYAKVLATDAFIVFPGRLMTREELVQEWGRRKPWADAELDAERLTLVNGETVLISYHVVAHDEEGREYRARISSVYTWVAGWALAFRQHTPDPDSPIQNPAQIPSDLPA